MNPMLADPDLWLYRERTIALLKRYLRISIQVGCLPSLLGRELFPSKVTSYRMSGFEGAVIFVHDVERALAELDGFARQVITTVIFQDYDQDEAAEVLRCALLFLESMKKPLAVPSSDLAALRKNITELVVQNAFPMVQQAIDAVREDGQYQAIKYLFEMIGLYPAASQDGSDIAGPFWGLDAAASADQMDENESQPALP